MSSMFGLLLACLCHLFFECFEGIPKALLTVQNMFGGFFWCASTMCAFLVRFLASFSVSKVDLGLPRHFHGVYKLV